MTEREMELAKRASKILGQDATRMNLNDIIGGLLEVNERYEKALKFYANKENYECEDDTLDPSVSYIHIVDMDSGEEARKALGEE